MREYLLFVRTKTAVHLSHEQDLLMRIVDALPDDVIARPEADQYGLHYGLHWLSFGKGQEAWENGAALRLRAVDDIERIALDIGLALQEDVGAVMPDALLICDRSGPMIEIPAGGSAARFCEAIGYDGCLAVADVSGPYSVRSPRHLSLIALTYFENDLRVEDKVAALRASLSSPCYPLFHLRDGQVMAMETVEPASITSRRSIRHFAHFKHWAVFDADGHTRASDGTNEKAWLPVEFEDEENKDDVASVSVHNTL